MVIFWNHWILIFFNILETVKRLVVSIKLRFFIRVCVNIIIFNHFYIKFWKHWILTFFNILENAKRLVFFPHPITFLTCVWANIVIFVPYISNYKSMYVQRQCTGKTKLIFFLIFKPIIKYFYIFTVQ